MAPSPGCPSGMTTVRRRSYIALLALLLAAPLTGCATAVSVDNQGNGTCVQKTERKAFGLTYGSDQNLINCDAEVPSVR